jgi:hypothetical protein
MVIVSEVVLVRGLLIARELKHRSVLDLIPRARLTDCSTVRMNPVYLKLLTGGRRIGVCANAKMTEKNVLNREKNMWDMNTIAEIRIVDRT